MKIPFIGLIIGGAGGLFVGIILGIFIAQGLTFWQAGGTSIPYDSAHWEIGHGFTVRDLTDNQILELKHVMTGPATFHPYAPLDMFKARQTYTQSLWIWTSENDIDVVMTIWGAGEDGKTYLIEVSRHTGNTIEIKGYGYTCYWPAGSSDAYASFPVTLS